MTQSVGDRLRYARERWGWSQDELARAAAVGVATIRRAEGGKFEPRLETARRLADALFVRVEWLLTGSDPMLGLEHMTVEEQHRCQSGPGTEGLPGYVIVSPGPWYRDGDVWKVNRAAVRSSEGQKR